MATVVQQDAPVRREWIGTTQGDANEEAVRLVTLRYESGLSAYFEVLDAMERLLAMAASRMA